MEKPIEQDTKFQEREYRFEVWGRWLVGTVILSAVLGLYGDGVFSKARETFSAGEIEHTRSGRRNSEMEYNLRIDSPNNPVLFSIPNTFLREIDIVEIIPDPLVEGGPETTRFSFANGEKKGLKVRFVYEPKVSGRLEAAFLLDSKEKVSFTQFIFP